MKFNLKKLLIYIVITFFIGSFFALLIDSTGTYANLNKAINVPSIVFPIVWSILYTLMGISVYIISESKDNSKRKALKSYFLQLIVNSLWTLLFFGFNLYSFSLVWLVLLIVLVIIMVVKFYKINKIAGIMNLPYLIWLLFASYLNVTIVLLN